MELKVTNTETSVKLPILSSRSNYLTWKDEIKRYCKTLKLKPYLDYAFNEPYCQLENSVDLEGDDTFISSQSINNR